VPSLEEIVAEAVEAMGDRELEALLVRGMSEAQVAQYRVGYSQDPLPLPGLGKVDDCWVFPLTNSLGQIRGVQVRPVVRSRKIYVDYLAPGSEAEPVLFGLAEAMPHCWELGYCFLVEGVFDLPPIQRAAPATVATVKAGLTPQLARLLRRMGVRVYLGWDNDPAGLKARKDCRINHPDLSTVSVHYPKEPLPKGGTTKDPGDLWELWGTKKMDEFVTQCLG
jgi:hypothetical protein